MQHLLSSDGSVIEQVGDFKYLGGLTDSCHEMNTRIAQAWSAAHALERIWKANVKKETKLKVFKGFNRNDTPLWFRVLGVKRCSHKET